MPEKAEETLSKHILSPLVFHCLESNINSCLMLKQCQHKIQISSVSQQSSYLLAFMGYFSIFMLEAAKLFAVSWILKHIKKNGRRCNRNSRIPSSQRIIIGIKEEQFKQITMKHSNTIFLAEYLTRDS